MKKMAFSENSKYENSVVIAQAILAVAEAMHELTEFLDSDRRASSVHDPSPNQSCASSDDSD